LLFSLIDVFVVRAMDMDALQWSSIIPGLEVVKWQAQARQANIGRSRCEG
jgi:hypothetical protein